MYLIAGHATPASETEWLRIAYLDSHARQIAHDHFTDAAPDHVMLPMRTIVGNALSLDARRIVMSHNHPSGSLEPSRQDYDATRLLARTLDAIDVILHDHVIIAGDHRFSFREAGLL